MSLKKRKPAAEPEAEPESEEPAEALPQPEEREAPQLPRGKGPQVAQEVKEEVWEQALERATERQPQSLESLELMMDAALAREESKREAKAAGEPWAGRPPWPSAERRQKDFRIGEAPRWARCRLGRCAGRRAVLCWVLRCERLLAVCPLPWGACSGVPGASAPACSPHLCACTSTAQRASTAGPLAHAPTRRPQQPRRPPQAAR
jgi:hypothetical protein